MAKKTTAAPSGKQLPLSRLMTKVATGNITQEEVAAYFFAAHPGAGDFVPRLKINATTVDIAGKEQIARDVEHDLGYRAVEAVSAAQREAAGAPAPDGTIVAEGDSWFNLPEFGFPINVPPTLVDILAASKPINNIAHWGDTLAQIVNAAEYVPYLKTKKVKCFLFSAGGNDVLGNGLIASFLRQRESGDNNPKNAAKYINPLFDQSLNNIMFLFTTLIENVRQLSPKTRIVIHGYDYAIPANNGPWLGVPLASRGFDPLANPKISAAVIAVMIDRFNERLSNLAAKSGGRVEYVRFLGTVKTDWWDELHPNKVAVTRLAAKMGPHLP